MKKLTLLIIISIQCFFALAQDMPKGLNVNDKAPLFAAKDQSGKVVSLKGLLQKGSVVLVFYRGQWCPYCNKQLASLEDSLKLIMEKGASLIAVTPERQENVDKTIKKTKASYAILSDEGLSIMKSYDVAFTVDSATIKKYKGYGIDFNEANGGNGAHLPVPAVFVINKDGIIVYRYFDVDYRKRASVAEILTKL